MVRGLPVIHLNFLGYDEQAHCRGPDSAFAHWALRGIDHAIRRTWRAARRASRRNYQVWVYSDHGQVKTASYSELVGRTVHQAVEAVVRGNHPPGGPPDESSAMRVRAGQMTLLADWSWRPTPNRSRRSAACRWRPWARWGRSIPLPGLARAARSDRPVPGGQGENSLGAGGRRGRPGAGLDRSGAIPLARGSGQGAGRRSSLLAAGRRRLDRSLSSPRGGRVGHRRLGLPGPCGQFLAQERRPRWSQPDETRAFAPLPHNSPMVKNDRGWLRPLELRRAVLEALGR